jgi:hypothetical protein
MEEKDKFVDNLRIKVIPFRDYYASDGQESMKESEFFDMPDQREEFSSFVNSIRATGGGSAPECGLEALSKAIRSDWTDSGDKQRQIIALWSDINPHPLEKNKDSKPSSYPDDMPSNFDELTNIWAGQGGPMKYSAKRLLVFAPDAEFWTDIGNYWDNSVHYASKAGKGLEDVDYDTILDAIAGSV